MVRKGKPSQGRRKIEMKKIESEEARHVCFSKRRIGVFTKASELSTMCGAKVAVVVYSPSGTPYSFGSPSVDSVVDSFLAQSPVRAVPNSAQQHAISQLSRQFMEASGKLDVEKKRKVMLDERAKAVSNSKEFELLQNMNQLNLDDLNQLSASLNRAKNVLNERIKALFPSHVRPPTMTNMGLLHGMSSSFGGVSGTMAHMTPPLLPVPPSGAIVGPVNYPASPFMPGSF